MTVTTLPQPVFATDVHYPESDGMPMAESDPQRKVLTYAVEALDCHFRDRPNVYVSGNIFMYYEEGNPKAVVSPDVLVVLGAEKRDRTSYFLWREPKAPDWVLEVTSRSTLSEDQGVKHGLYAYLGIREYFQFDPTGDYLRPRLVGFRLVGRDYRRMAAATSPDGELQTSSPVLGLDIRSDIDGRLAFYDPRTQTKLLTYAESEQARREAESRADREAAARQAAEARIAELEERLRALS